MNINKIFLNKTNKAGFTMIELLVVISIIGILAAMALVSFTASQRQARDSNRKSDLRQYSTSLESFANKTGGLYPSRFGGAGVVITTLCSDLTLSPCSNDPRYTVDGTSYYYSTDGSGSGTIDATRYVLWARLENTPEYWVVCSSGVNGAKSQTGWTAPSLGACPL